MKIFIGEVTSKKMEKTATVSVSRVIIHPIYNKRVKTVKKYQVHDELNTEVGQKVKFAASKPYSKTKKWKILKVVGDKQTKTDSLLSTVKTEEIVKATVKKAKAVKKPSKKS